MAMSTRRKRNKIVPSPLPLSTNSIHARKTSKSPILSDDIMIKIFNTLPHKTLMKLCIVCKSWLDMIANPHRSDSVYTLRLKSNPPSENLLIAFDDYNSKFGWTPIIFSASNNTNIGHNTLVHLQNAHLSSLYDDANLKVDDSSKNYILCHHRYYDETDYIWRWYYYVINPFSSQWLHLPVIKSSIYSIDFHCVGFRCEVDSTSPLAASHCTVVLDNSRKRVPCFNSSVLELRVLYSNNRGKVPASQWRKLSVRLQNGPGRTLDLRSPRYAEKGVILDGVFYWIHQDVLEAVYLTRAKAYKVIKAPYNDYTNYPQQKRDMTNYTMLGVFENKLFYGYQDYDDKIIRVFVYEGELLEGRGFWVLKYTMLPEVLVSSSSIEGVNDEGLMVILKGFHPKNPAIFFFFNKWKQFMSYDAQTQCLVVHHNVNSCPYILCEWSDAWPQFLPLVR